MVAIAQCESGMEQFKNGRLLRDYKTGDHVGIYQISESVWSAKAKSLGFDIRTAQGNISMALWIYNRYGTSPWLASEGCWSKGGVYV